MSKAVAFIPARGGSKSIPRKNAKFLGGKPLIVWSIDSALEAGLRVVVSTDDEEIAEIARERGGVEILMRPSELAQDETSMFDVLKSEIPKIQPAPEIVILLQPTTPFRNPMEITMAAGMHVDELDSLITVEPVPEKYNPAQVIISDYKGNRMASGEPIANRITRRQEFPHAYVPTGSVYAFKPSNLEKGSFYGERVMLLQTESTININDMADWEEAEQYVKSR